MVTGIAALDHRIVRPFVVRALGVWIIAHAAWAVMAQSFVLLPLTTIGLAVVGGIVCLLDSRRRHELLFLRNLGVPPVTIGMICGATIIVAELIAATIVAPILGLR
jgi:hypothetical protein